MFFQLNILKLAVREVGLQTDLGQINRPGTVDKVSTSGLSIVTSSVAGLGTRAPGSPSLWTV